MIEFGELGCVKFEILGFRYEEDIFEFYTEPSSDHCETDFIGSRVYEDESALLPCPYVTYKENKFLEGPLTCSIIDSSILNESYEEKRSLVLRFNTDRGIFKTRFRKEYGQSGVILTWFGDKQWWSVL